MESRSQASEAEVKERVHSFCQALATKNLNKLRDMMGENVSLSWGPYGFEGNENVLTWAKELFELFPFMAFKEASLEVKGPSAKHEFMISFLTTDGQKGWLPCVGSYEFRDGLLKELKVQLLHGWLAVSRDDVEKVKPGPSPQ